MILMMELILPILRGSDIICLVVSASILMISNSLKSA